MEKEAAIELIRASAPSEYVETLVSLLNASSRIVVGDDALTISHFGGLPSLPEGLSWPVWDKGEFLKVEIAALEKRIAAKTQRTEHRPEKVPGLRERLLARMQNRLARMHEEMLAPVLLAFLGQLSLREICAVSTPSGLPRDGVLAFFYDADCPWGFSPLHRGHCQVLFIPENLQTAERAFPSELPVEARFPNRSLTFECEWTLPRYLELNDGQLIFYKMDWYSDLVEKLNSGGSVSKAAVHRCGGYPQEIQGDMRLECQLVTNGIDCGGPAGYKDPRTAELASGALDWRLLAQFDSDEKLGWMWGDTGRVYFWAREQDILSADFSNAWAVLQCY